MSLLPSQILPQTVPIGHVDDRGKVIIDKQWWLLIYNIMLNSVTATNNDNIMEDMIFSPRMETQNIISADNLLNAYVFEPRKQTANLGNSQEILQQRIFGR